jgi:hypothetical protein
MRGPIGILFVLGESGALGLRERLRLLLRFKGENGFVVIDRRDDCMNDRTFRIFSRRYFNAEGHHTFLSLTPGPPPFSHAGEAD